jgi:hypothetical protein
VCLLSYFSPFDLNSSQLHYVITVKVQKAQRGTVKSTKGTKKQAGTPDSCVSCRLTGRSTGCGADPGEWRSRAGVALCVVAAFPVDSVGWEVLTNSPVLTAPAEGG